MEAADTGFWAPRIEPKKLREQVVPVNLFCFLSGVRKDEFFFFDLVRLSALPGCSKI